MKLKSIWTFVALSSLCLSTTSFAGVGSSGGGHAVVCRTPLGVIQKAQLLDLAEAESKGLQLAPSSGDLFKDFARIVRLYNYLKGNSIHLGDNGIREYFDELMGDITFLSDQASLPPVLDLGEAVVAPMGCAIEQVAFYRDFDNKILVKKSIWNAMSPLDQAALLQHEVIYQTMRNAGETTSRNVRRLVGQLFSTTPGPSLFDLLNSDSIACNTGMEFDGQLRRSNQIYFTPDPITGKSKLILMNFMGRETFLPLVFDFPMVVNENTFRENFDAGSGQWVPVPIAPTVNMQWQGIVQAGVFEDYQLRISLQHDQPVALEFLSETAISLKKNIFFDCVKARR